MAPPATEVQWESRHGGGPSSFPSLPRRGKLNWENWGSWKGSEMGGVEGGAICQRPQGWDHAYAVSPDLLGTGHPQLCHPPVTVSPACPMLGGVPDVLGGSSTVRAARVKQLACGPKGGLWMPSWYGTGG